MTSMLMLSAMLAAAPVGPGAEADWVAFLDHDDGSTSYYDRAGVQRDGQIVRVWVRWDRSSESEPPFEEGRILDELDCSAGTVRILRFGAYRGDGTELARRDSPLESAAVIENTPGGALSEILCPAQPAASGK